MADSVAALMLASATIDVAAAKVLDAAPGMSDIAVGFHVQQACEKCLKAVLSAAGIEFSRTHDLVRLMDLLAANGVDIPENSKWIDVLNPYAVEARYGLVAADQLERARAIAAAQELLAWAQGRADGMGSN